jgi:hypothetical protein
MMLMPDQNRTTARKKAITREGMASNLSAGLHRHRRPRQATLCQADMVFLFMK